MSLDGMLKVIINYINMLMYSDVIVTLDSQLEFTCIGSEFQSSTV